MRAVASLVLSLLLATVLHAKEKPVSLELRLADAVGSSDTEELPLAGTRESVHVRKVPVLTVKDIVKAEARKDESVKGVVAMTLTRAGRKKLAKATGDNVGKRLAIVVDGSLLTAPEIKQKIVSDKVLLGIEDAVSMDATTLANRINATKKK